MMKQYKELPFLVVSDESGNLFEIPELRMIGMCINQSVIPESDELIPLPEGSDLFKLPGRKPIGYNPEIGEIVRIDEYYGEPVFAAAAFMAPAYVQFYRSAYQTLSKVARLPLYAYTAVGWYNDKFYVTGMRIDSDQRQDFRNFNLPLIEKNAITMSKKYPKNRLVQHLINNCVFRYGCPAARNLVMGRWECPVPASPACNADCVGCISKQPEESGICASQDRLDFIPSVEEIVEYTVPHLENAPRAVISFGQGCEGEPLMVGDLLEQAIREIRKKTNKGVINLNTNASLPDIIERLFKAGLDSIRVSMNSAQKYYYEKYHQPKNYQFEDVIESLKIARQLNRWLSLNYFIFPGLTDHPEEINSLIKLIEKFGINLIQTRNLNMDPEWYIEALQLNDLSPNFIGIKNWIATIKSKFPDIKFGYFNPPLEGM